MRGVTLERALTRRDVSGAVRTALIVCRGGHSSATVGGKALRGVHALESCSRQVMARVASGPVITMRGKAGLSRECVHAPCQGSSAGRVSNPGHAAQS